MAGIAEPDRLAVLDDVRHDQHFRMAGQRELVQHVDLQRAEAAAERDVLVRRDALVAKHQYVVIEVRAMDAREIVGVERLRQVDADHLGAERRVERHDVEMLRRAVRPQGGMPGGKRCGVAEGGSRHGAALIRSKRESTRPCRRASTKRFGYVYLLR